MIRILVENLTFVGRHGVYEEERRDGRKFRADLVVESVRGDSTDDVASTVDYRALASTILEHGHGPSVELVETLADRITQSIYERFESIRRVDLTIRKYATGVPGDPEWVGVRLQSERDDRRGLA